MISSMVISGPTRRVERYALYVMDVYNVVNWEDQ